MLEIGSMAPDFTLVDQNGEEHTLSEYKGNTVVLYFYPKDDTPGCTKEACSIRDSYPEFEEKGIIVMGVSKDSAKTHRKFAEKYNLPFILLADIGKAVIEKYGAHKELGGTARISYIIDTNGAISHVFPKVTPASHADELLEMIS